MPDNLKSMVTAGLNTLAVTGIVGALGYAYSLDRQLTLAEERLAVHVSEHEKLNHRVERIADQILKLHMVGGGDQ